MNIQEVRLHARVNNLARLFQLLTNVFGLEKTQDKLGKIEGQEVSVHFPHLGDQWVTMKVASKRLLPSMGRSERPAAIMTFFMQSDEIIPIVVKIIRMKPTGWNLLKLTLKYILPGRIRIRGSLRTCSKFLQCIMIGAHPMYARESTQKLIYKESPKEPRIDPLEDASQLRHNQAEHALGG